MISFPLLWEKPVLDLLANTFHHFQLPVCLCSLDSLLNQIKHVIYSIIN